MNIKKRTHKQNYVQLNKSDIPLLFKIKGDKVYLENSWARPIKVDFPLILNENIAKISAMILDGTLNKKLNGCSFSQKKDKAKVTEFSNIVKGTFGINGNFSIDNKSGTHIIGYTRKAFAYFLHQCLDIHKSDEEARIPYWIWISPKSVIIEYLRYAFAMEGSVSHYLKATEIKFHSVELSYLKDLKKLLKDKFNIDSKIFKYFIKGYGWKYYLHFSDKNNIKCFSNIGFALESHQKRLRGLISYFKNKAWEITLVSILNMPKKIFILPDVNMVFPYLCRRAIHDRLSKLLQKGYLQKEKYGFSLTKEGRRTALSLKDKVKITKLRTNPKENEEKVIQFLNIKKESYRNEIARELKINPITVRDTIRRLVKKDKVKAIGTDKFQRRFYKLNK